MERLPPHEVASANVCACREQASGNLSMPTLRGEVQRRLTELSLGVNINPNF
jgi:hypothetical protein